jgi:DNA-binding Xre family transcriptional regulator
MISYEKFRIYLMRKKLKISNICKEAGLSTNVGTKINNDESIEVKSLEKICLHMSLTPNDVVEFLPDENK